MAKATEQEKIMHKVAQAYVDTYGTRTSTDVTLDSGNVVVIVPPNRFGYGYIKLIYPVKHEIWTASLKKNDASKISTIHGGIFDPVKLSYTSIQ